MKNLRKKFACLFLAFLFFAISASAGPVCVNARVTAILEPETSTEYAQAGVPVIRDFTVQAPCQAAFAVAVETPVGFTLTLYNSAGVELDSTHFTASDPDWLPLNDIYFNDCTIELPAGDYKAELIFDESAAYQFAIIGNEPEATLSSHALTITAGFDKTLSVSDNSGSIQWTSSKPSVASVNSKGKVSAKKAGKCTITASVDGKKLKCTVTVQSNKYTAAKLTNSQIPNGSASWEAFSAFYDAKGNLVIKCRMVNNSGHYSEYLKDLSIKVKTADKKTAAVYKASKKNLYVSDQGYKDFKITISKDSLKIKKPVDLRNASVTTDGKYGYTYYSYQ